MPELTSHGGTMDALLRYQWRDTICGGGAYGCIVARAVADLLSTLTARITDEIRQNENNGNNDNRRNDRRVNTGGSGNDKDAQPTDIHVWILNTEFTDVAQVANAARNIEIFCDRSKNEGNNKRDKDGHHIRPSETPSQGSNQRAYDQRDNDRYGSNGRYGNRDRYGSDRWCSDRQGSDRQGNGSDRRGTGTQRAWLDQDQQVRGQHYGRSYGSSSHRGYSDYVYLHHVTLVGNFIRERRVTGLLVLALNVEKLGI
uniref:Zinc finger, CCHC-type, retrotransposon Gag domain protein n=1 Tax=Tanacetum cinerariifolium TaxID=118510 RepID=A0A6L2LBY4_TANCI|nr:zinc finger, CCHC-type, retrotransposon Gag domain protein [Tanacetum cinerariifolium]